MQPRKRGLQGKERYAYEKAIEIRRDEVLKIGINAFHKAFKAANYQKHYWDDYLATSEIKGIIRKDGSLEPYHGEKNFKSLKNALIEINDFHEATNTVGLTLGQVIINDEVLELDDSEMDFVCAGGMLI